RGDVPPGRDGRPCPPALPRRRPARALRRRGRTRGPAPGGPFTAPAPARRGLPGLQRAPGQPDARTRRRADDALRLAGARPAGPPRGVPLVVVAVVPRTEDIDRPREDPPAARTPGSTAPDRAIRRLHRAGDGGHRPPRSRGSEHWRSPGAARPDRRAWIDQ